MTRNHCSPFFQKKVYQKNYSSLKFIDTITCIMKDIPIIITDEVVEFISTHSFLVFNNNIMNTRTLRMFDDHDNNSFSIIHFTSSKLE